MNDPNENLPDKEIDEGKVLENVHAVNAAMKDSVLKKDYQSLEITDAEITKFLKVVPHLDSMEEACTYLGGEKHVTASSVIPFLVSFNNDLAPNEEDVEYVGIFKIILREDLMKRCARNLNIQLLVRSSYFDRRYSSLDFLSNIGFLRTYIEDDDWLSKAKAIDEIEYELKQIEDKLNGPVDRETFTGNKQPPRKKAKFLIMACQGGANAAGGDGLPNGGARQFCDAENEMAKYAQEPPMHHYGDVLQWWHDNKRNYPCHAELARKYLSIQATSTTAERVMSLMVNIVTKKRSLLTDENVCILTYLSDCYQ